MQVEVLNVWNGSVTGCVSDLFLNQLSWKEFTFMKKTNENMQLCFVNAIENEAQNNQGLSVMHKMGV